MATNPNPAQNIREILHQLLKIVKPFYMQDEDLAANVPYFLNDFITHNNTGAIELDMFGSFIKTMHLHQIGTQNSETNEIHVLQQMKPENITPQHTAFEKLLVGLWLKCATDQGRIVTRDELIVLQERNLPALDQPD